MELLQLKYFKTVAEKGKISEAAQALFISAPALSTSIARLEKELGIKLFDRSNNRIVLNRYGHILLRYVNQVFATLDCAKTELRQSAMLQQQHISIASVASTQWVDMITAFSQEYPHFTLLCTGITRAGLLSGEFSARHSFLLAAEDDVPEVFGDRLDSAFLFEDHPVVMVHKDHPIAGQKAVALEQLRNETLFLPLQDYPLFDHLAKLFANSGVPFPAGNAYSHLATQQMTAQGLGVAFATSHTALGNPQQLRYVPIADDYTPWRNRLYWRKNQTLTPDEECFKAFILNYYHS